MLLFFVFKNDKLTGDLGFISGNNICILETFNSFFKKPNVVNNNVFRLSTIGLRANIT